MSDRWDEIHELSRRGLDARARHAELPRWRILARFDARTEELMMLDLIETLYRLDRAERELAAWETLNPLSGTTTAERSPA